MSDHQYTSTRNENGTTTYRIPALMYWFTTSLVEVEAMVAQHAAVGHYEQEK